jgi:hypothetical protein
MDGGRSIVLTTSPGICDYSEKSVRVISKHLHHNGTE